MATSSTQSSATTASDDAFDTLKAKLTARTFEQGLQLVPPIASEPEAEEEVEDVEEEEDEDHEGDEEEEDEDEQDQDEDVEDKDSELDDDEDEEDEEEDEWEHMEEDNGEDGKEEKDEEEEGEEEEEEDDHPVLNRIVVALQDEPPKPLDVQGQRVLGGGAQGTVLKTELEGNRLVARKVQMQHLVRYQGVYIIKPDELPELAPAAVSNTLLAAAVPPALIVIFDMDFCPAGTVAAWAELRQAIPLPSLDGAARRAAADEEWGFYGLDVPQAASFCLDYIQAVAALHRARLMHGDVKPPNTLLIRGEGRHGLVKLVLSDLSGARAMDATGHIAQGGSVATSLYVPLDRPALPGSEARHASDDTFAAGVSMAELLWGFEAFHTLFPRPDPGSGELAPGAWPLLMLLGQIGRAGLVLLRGALLGAEAGDFILGLWQVARLAVPQWCGLSNVPAFVEAARRVYGWLQQGEPGGAAAVMLAAAAACMLRARRPAVQLLAEYQPWLEEVAARKDTLPLLALPRRPVQLATVDGDLLDAAAPALRARWEDLKAGTAPPALLEEAVRLAVALTGLPELGSEEEEHEDDGRGEAGEQLSAPPSPREPSVPATASAGTTAAAPAPPVLATTPAADLPPAAAPPPSLPDLLAIPTAPSPDPAAFFLPDDLDLDQLAVPQHKVDSRQEGERQGGPEAAAVGPLPWLPAPAPEAIKAVWAAEREQPPPLPLLEADGAVLPPSVGPSAPHSPARSLAAGDEQPRPAEWGLAPSGSGGDAQATLAAATQPLVHRAGTCSAPPTTTHQPRAGRWWSRLAPQPEVGGPAALPQQPALAQVSAAAAGPAEDEPAAVVLQPPEVGVHLAPPHQPPPPPQQPQQQLPLALLLQPPVCDLGALFRGTQQALATGRVPGAARRAGRLLLGAAACVLRGCVAAVAMD